MFTNMFTGIGPRQAGGAETEVTNFMQSGKMSTKPARKAQIMLLLFSKDVSAGGLKYHRAIYVSLEF